MRYSTEKKERDFTVSLFQFFLINLPAKRGRMALFVRRHADIPAPAAPSSWTTTSATLADPKNDRTIATVSFPLKSAIQRKEQAIELLKGMTPAQIMAVISAINK